jgi:hypothetical protein
MRYFYPISRQNKHTWNYRFLYWNNDKPDVYDYSINTDKGFQVAESAAWGNANWDNCNNLKYIGKKKVGG